jgi:glycosyltransferase involved in cell wall biosynthesis
LQFGISDVDISDYSAGGAPVFTTHFSSVDVDRAFFAERVKSKNERAQRLLFIGSLSQMYKGADILVQALATCVRKGLDVNLEIVGDGRHRPDLESLVERLRLGRRVTFLGELPPGSAIRERLDSADVFVLPSRSEGLPRAMVEAMARGLPCIGTTVGGIPELLPPEDMVPPGNVDLLASLIEDVCINPKRMERMAMRNLAKAAEYRDDVLRSRRNDFYRHIRQETAKWLESKAGPPSTLT